MVVVPAGAPPCELLSTIRGPATHCEAECRVVPARDNMNLDYRDHMHHTFLVVYRFNLHNAPGKENMDIYSIYIYGLA